MNIKKVIEGLDKIADSIEKVNPNIALAIDVVSDHLENVHTAGEAYEQYVLKKYKDQINKTIGIMTEIISKWDKDGYGWGDKRDRANYTILLSSYKEMLDHLTDDIKEKDLFKVKAGFDRLIKSLLPKLKKQLNSKKPVPRDYEKLIDGAVTEGNKLLLELEPLIWDKGKSINPKVNEIFKEMDNDSNKE